MLELLQILSSEQFWYTCAPLFILFSPLLLSVSIDCRPELQMCFCLFCLPAAHSCSPHCVSLKQTRFSSKHREASASNSASIGFRPPSTFHFLSLEIPTGSHGADIMENKSQSFSVDVAKSEWHFFKSPTSTRCSHSWKPCFNVNASVPS